MALSGEGDSDGKDTREGGEDCCSASSRQIAFCICVACACEASSICRSGALDSSSCSTYVLNVFGIADLEAKCPVVGSGAGEHSPTFSSSESERTMRRARPRVGWRPSDPRGERGDSCFDMVASRSRIFYGSLSLNTERDLSRSSKKIHCGLTFSSIHWGSSLLRLTPCVRVTRARAVAPCFVPACPRVCAGIVTWNLGVLGAGPDSGSQKAMLAGWTGEKTHSHCCDRCLMTHRRDVDRRGGQLCGAHRIHGVQHYLAL